MNPIFVSVPEACDLLRIGRSSFYEAVYRGEICIRKAGKRSLVAVADLQHWADSLPVANLGDTSEAA